MESTENFVTSNLENKNFWDYINIVILVFLTLQIFTVSFSVAISSISFGIWGGLWIIQILFRKEPLTQSFVKNDVLQISFLILGFLISDFLSRVFGVIPEGALIGLKRFLLYLIFFGAIVKITKKEHLYRIILLGVIIFAGVSLYELTKYVIKFRELSRIMDIGLIRIDDLAYPLTTAEIKMLLLLLIIPLLFIPDSPIIKRTYLVILLIPIIISMFLTQSRNVIFAFIITTLILTLLRDKKIFLITLGTLLVIFLILPYPFQHRITSSFSPSFELNKSRITMWKVGWQMFKDHPIVGVGDNEITLVYKKYKEPEIKGEGSHLHSNYVMILATNGILGSIFYLSLMILLFVKFLKFYRECKLPEDRLLILGAILGFIAFHIAGLTEWEYGDWEVLTIFIFVVSIPFIIINFVRNQKAVTNE
ncbi:MAG: O-antigen ligase family protein [Ignavibacteria bacterium]